MHFEKITGIVLRVTPYSRTSHIITWLTEERGQIVTMAKGACRPKSAFLGQYDRLYTCELVYYAREGRAIHVARECAPINCRSGFREDWRAALCALQVTDLVYRTTAPAAPAARIYRLTETTLDFLCENEARPSVPLWFELQLLSALGLAPQFDSCVKCGAEADGAVSLPFSAVEGGVYCSSCRGGARAGWTLISPPVLALLRSWQASELPRLAHSTRCSRDQLLASRQVLGVLLSYHLGEATEMREEAYRAVFPSGIKTPRSGA